MLPQLLEYHHFDTYMTTSKLFVCRFDLVGL
jgi:hypothetical protein